MQKISKNFKKIKHDNYDILTEELKKIITNNNYDNIYICGIYLDVCIAKFVMDTFNMQIPVKIILDCSASQFEDDTPYTESLKRILSNKNIIESNKIK